MRLLSVIASAVLACCQVGAARDAVDASTQGAAVRAEAEAATDGGSAPRADGADPDVATAVPAIEEAPRAAGRASSLGAPRSTRLPLKLAARFRQLGVAAGGGGRLRALAVDEEHRMRLASFDRQGRAGKLQRLELGIPLFAETCGDELVVVGLVRGECESAGGSRCGPSGPAVVAGVTEEGEIAWREDLESPPSGLVCAMGESTPRLYWAERSAGCPAPTTPNARFRWARVDEGGALTDRGELQLPHHAHLSALWVDGAWTVAQSARGPGELELFRIDSSGITQRARVADATAGHSLTYVDGRYAVLWQDGEATVRLRWITRGFVPEGEDFEVALAPEERMARWRSVRAVSSPSSVLAILADVERTMGHRSRVGGGGGPIIRHRCHIRLYDWAEGNLGPAIDHEGPCSGDWVGDQLLLFSDGAVLRYPTAR